MAACVLDTKSCEPHHRTTCRVWALPQPSVIVKHCTLCTASTLSLPSIASATVASSVPKFRPRPGRAYKRQSTHQQAHIITGPMTLCQGVNWRSKARRPEIGLMSIGAWCRSRAAARSRMAASGRPASMHVDDYERNPLPKESPGKGAAAKGSSGAGLDASRLQDPSYIAVNPRILEGCCEGLVAAPLALRSCCLSLLTSSG